mmetsp:Transcript_4517/g.10546  ORF Transcript_4517/g.10546 Transcript_4517/m.10546 type:complete len:767 (-) Transcript_4517:90-2390(-)
MDSPGTDELPDSFGEHAALVMSEVYGDISTFISAKLERAASELASVHELALQNGGSGTRARCRSVQSQRVSLDELDMDLSELTPQDSLRDGSAKSLARPRHGSNLSSEPQSPRSVNSLRSHGDWEGDAPSRWRSEALQSEPMTPYEEGVLHYRAFELQGVWKADEVGPRKSGSDNRMKRRFSMAAKTRDFRSGEEVMATSCRRCAMRPNSITALSWDVCCTIAIVHDMIMIPLTSAFPVDTQGAQAALDLCSSIVWMVDLPLSFCRGYLDTRKGFVEMRPAYIASHYVRTWFVTDAILVACDAMTLVNAQPNLTTLTLIRLVRNVRILRLLKMTSRLATLKETMVSFDHRFEFGSVHLETALTVLRQLTIISLLCHFLGCAWYAIGNMALANTWVHMHEAWRVDVMTAGTDWPYMYVTSMHWALTQFTPAAMDVVAVNMFERLFSFFVTLGGLIVFSFFIGSINQSLARLRNLTAQELQQNQLVRRYVQENRVSVTLAAEILTFIKQRGVGKATSKLVASDIKVLEHLPRKLLSQLQHEVGMPVMQQHGLLNYLSSVNHEDIARLCHKAFVEVAVIHGEELFQAGNAGEKMWFMRGGRLHYVWEPDPHMQEDVTEGMRVSEASLWLKWEYRGRLYCEDQSSHIFHLNAHAFRKAISRSELLEGASIYARLFLRMLGDEYGQLQDAASDLFGTDEHVKEIMKLVRSWEDGAAKVFASLMENALGIEEVFDAWREAVAARKQAEATQRSWFTTSLRRCLPGGRNRTIR